MTNGKNNYKLISLDMDGTLLKPDKSVHPDTVRDIEEASAKGIHIVYCTGRAVPEIQQYIPMFKGIRYAVCMSGALVYDLKEKKTIYRNAISCGYVQKIMEAAKEYDGMFYF